jgi:ketosteroid isomerase-like protein
VDPKERTIRDFYDARARRDWDAVGSLFADEVGYHEPGDEDHSGDFKGRDEVVALLTKLVDVTDGTFQLDPDGFLNLDQHSAVIVNWSSERDDRRSEGRELAIFRFEHSRIAEVWFYNEPSNPDAFSAVFAFDAMNQVDTHPPDLALIFRPATKGRDGTYVCRAEIANHGDRAASRVRWWLTTDDGEVVSTFGGGDETEIGPREVMQLEVVVTGKFSQFITCRLAWRDEEGDHEKRLPYVESARHEGRRLRRPR